MNNSPADILPITFVFTRKQAADLKYFLGPVPENNAKKTNLIGLSRVAAVMREELSQHDLEAALSQDELASYAAANSPVFNNLDFEISPVVD